jgi:1-aminocyclopropane-1-carboxylate deaminase/D-cysteine desulfhydrase-like pyridoxal-dependent ACC family enzyme
MIQAITPLHPLRFSDGRKIYYIKRDDLFSFGGTRINAAITWITYGNSSFNLFRVIANMSKAKACIVILQVDEPFKKFKLKLIINCG